MKESANTRLTFAILDRQKGFAKLPPATEEEYPLPAWYRAVCEVPLDKLELEDICKACRQQIHLEHVVPLALRTLKSEPLAGEMYDGELLVSLKSVPADYWRTHPDEVLTLKPIIEAVWGNENAADDLRQDAQELLVKLRSAPGIPTGFKSFSPGLRGTRYSGSLSKQIINRNAVVSSRAKLIQPVPGCVHFRSFTQRRPTASSYTGLIAEIPLGFSI